MEFLLSLIPPIEEEKIKPVLVLETQKRKWVEQSSLTLLNAGLEN